MKKEVKIDEKIKPTEEKEVKMDEEIELELKEAWDKYQELLEMCQRMSQSGTLEKFFEHVDTKKAGAHIIMALQTPDEFFDFARIYQSDTNQFLTYMDLAESAAASAKLAKEHVHKLYKSYKPNQHLIVDEHVLKFIHDYEMHFFGAPRKHEEIKIVNKCSESRNKPTGDATFWDNDLLIELAKKNTDENGDITITDDMVDEYNTRHTEPWSRSQKTGASMKVALQKLMKRVIR